jgi:hypothetical protein
MVARSKCSNQRPDTLMQDRNRQLDENLLQRTAGPYIGSQPAVEDPEAHVRSGPDQRTSAAFPAFFALGPISDSLNEILSDRRSRPAQLNDLVTLAICCQRAAISSGETVMGPRSNPSVRSQHSAENWPPAAFGTAPDAVHADDPRNTTPGATSSGVSSGARLSLIVPCKGARVHHSD